MMKILGPLLSYAYYKIILNNDFVLIKFRNCRLQNKTFLKKITYKIWLHMAFKEKGTYTYDCIWHTYKHIYIYEKQET